MSQLDQMQAHGKNQTEYKCMEMDVDRDLFQLYVCR